MFRVSLKQQPCVFALFFHVSTSSCFVPHKRWIIGLNKCLVCSNTTDLTLKRKHPVQSCKPVPGICLTTPLPSSVLLVETWCCLVFLKFYCFTDNFMAWWQWCNTLVVNDVLGSAAHLSWWCLMCFVCVLWWKILIKMCVQPA